MCAVDITPDEAAALAHALTLHVKHLDALLGPNACWPQERERMVALFSRLRRVALPLIDDDPDDCPNVYADDADFF